MKCLSCGAEGPGGSKFCTECGAGMGTACPACRHLNQAGAKFCGQCGAKLDDRVEDCPVAASKVPVAERRQVTILFCDLVGSTPLSSRLDPEDFRNLIGAYHGCCTDVIARAGGFVAKYMGDGVLAYFGYPQAHEDDAERAVHAGLALVDAVRNLDDGAPLAVRVGIATGLVVVGDLLGKGGAQGQAVIGETPNLAARLQTLAEPGAVVIAASTRQLLGGFSTTLISASLR